MSATMAPAATPSPASVVGGIPFTVASRPQSRYSNVQTVSNLNGPVSFQVVQLPATGWVRRISLFFNASMTCASAAALVAGDAPWNLINAITLTDATGQPVQQPISGYNLYLVNKFMGSGVEKTNIPRIGQCKQLGPEFNLATSSTSGSATFRLDIDFEQDVNTGYGCIPNLDSNASLQLKVDVAQYTNAFTGTTVSAASVSMRVSQYYWAPVPATIGGQPVEMAPPGAGDYVETRYETQVVSPSSENLITVTNRGGFIKGVILVSRAAGVRTAITPATNVGVLLDNQPIDEGIPVEEKYDLFRRTYGFLGADLTTSYAPLSAGVLPGLDRGVVPVDFEPLSGYRDSWLNTRVGSLFQFKLTPGASASTIEIITQLAQVRDSGAFFARD